MKPRRVLVLMHREQVPPANVEDLTDQQFNAVKVEYDVLGKLAELGHDVHPIGVADELHPIREAIAEHRPHVVFNLLLHFHDVPMYDSYVVSYLELLRSPYTGCNPRGILLASDKTVSKKILAYHRIPVPPFVAIPRGRRVRRPARLEFPLFVKSSIEHSSFGIAQASVVHDDESLAERVAFVHDHVGTDALVERYIEGRELSIGVLGNRRLTTFPVWEMTFANLPDGAEPIATSTLKWNLRYQQRVGLATGAARDLPDGAPEAIARLAKRVYRALGMSGFARVDLRMDAAGRAWVLEANPNCDLSFREDFAEAAEAAGLDYGALLERILSLGIAYEPGWKAG